jgi:hypothetical protein
MFHIILRFLPMNYNLSFSLFPFKKQPQNSKNHNYESPKNNTERVEWFF